MQLGKTCKNAGKVVELNKNLDKTLELSQKVLDFSQKNEEFFDARDKDSSDGDDGDNDRDGESDDNDGGDDDGDGDEDPLKKAIKESCHHPDNISSAVGTGIAYNEELIGDFFRYRDQLIQNGYDYDSATQRAVSLVQYTSEEDTYYLVSALNSCEKRLSAFELLQSEKYEKDFRTILEQFGNDANEAVNTVSEQNKLKAILIIKLGDKEYGLQAVQAIKAHGDKAVEALSKVPSKECAEFILNYGENAAEIGSLANSAVLSEILKYQEPAMANLIQGITVNTPKITKLLNEAAENDTDKCKELIALITERPEETPNDLLDVFSHEYINGVFMYLDNLSLLPDNMDTVWGLTPTERGVKIENYYASTEYSTWYHIGREYDGYFPIIDFQKGDEVISMKSLDPRLPSYQDMSYLKKTLNRYIYSLGTADIRVDGASTGNKILKVIVPQGTDIKSMYYLTDELLGKTEYSVTVIFETV